MRFYRLAGDGGYFSEGGQRVRGSLFVGSDGVVRCLTDEQLQAMVRLAGRGEYGGDSAREEHPYEKSR